MESIASVHCMNTYNATALSQTQSAAAQLQAAECDIDQASLLIRQAGTVAWESSAANLFRNWLATLAADISRQGSAISSQRTSIGQL